jgi:hypothetical protein
LQAQDREAEPFGERLGQIGLADAGRAFDQDRLAQAMGQEHRRRNLACGNIANGGESCGDCIDGTERLVAGGNVFCHAKMG